MGAISPLPILKITRLCLGEDSSISEVAVTGLEPAPSACIPSHVPVQRDGSS